VTFPDVPARAKAVAVFAACLLSFVIGHGTRKAVEVEKVREVERVAEAKVEAARAEVATAKTAADSDKIQWRTKTVYLPGGTVEVTKEVVREVEKKTEERAAQVVTRRVTVEKVVWRDRLQVVAAPAPRWAVGAAAGVDLQGRLRYGGALERRVAGGLWFTAGVDVPTRAATLGLRLEF
jgi:hypothetical protein